MQKKNVFLVSGRYRGVDGNPRGVIVDGVVCGATDVSTRKFIEKTMPDFVITTFTSLLALEDRAKKIRAALAGEDGSWSVMVDPALQALEAS